MTWGDIIDSSIEIDSKKGVYDIRYQKEGHPGNEPWPRRCRYTRTEWYCPRCGKRDVWECLEIDEDNAGHSHHCLVCGFGFMGGFDYPGLPKNVLAALLKHYRLSKQTGDGPNTKQG